MSAATRRIRAIGPFRLQTTSDRATAVAMLVAGVLALAIASPSLGGPPPGDPLAFAEDARFLRCGGDTAPVRYAFEIELARDYREHLPLMERTSELALDIPALVVVFDGPGPFVSRPTARPGSTAEPEPTPIPGIADVCIYVGPGGAGQLNYYRNVRIGGLRVDLDGRTLVPLTPLQTA